MATDNKNLGLAFQLISLMRNDNFDYIYRGLFSKKITENILNLTENKLHITEEGAPQISKQIYLVMVECLQNITRHQEEPLEGDIENSALFMMQQTEDKYVITTGNLIKNSKITKLKQSLDKINSLDVDELKAYYKNMLKNGIISSKGGAGLGLISMARKAKSKLHYDFHEVSKELSYFYFRTEIALGAESPELNSTSSFTEIVKIHKILNEENILLNFNGTFNKDNMVNLLPIIENQIYETINIKNRVLQVMIDMLQNIVNFSVPIDEENHSHEGNPGIFFLSRNKHDFFLTAGNYMNNFHIHTLKRKLDFVNKLSYDKLVAFHERISDYFSDKEINKPDLSIVEMRLRSKHFLKYRFDKINEEYSFFTIRAII